MNNYICCRWRDAVTDPPMDGCTKMVKTGKWANLELASLGDEWGNADDEKIIMKPGDQWLDITDIHAIPREKVQAAVDYVERNAEHRDDAIYAFCDYLGITPSEVTP